MSYGTLLYVTVGHTQTDNASQRKGYPIKKKYKQNDGTQNPRFPADYTQVGSDSYWLPFLDLDANDSNYIVYTEGDEYGWSDDQAQRAPQIPFSNPRTTKYDEFPANHKIVFSNQIYVATRYTFDWGLSGFGLDKNPYKSSIIRKWKRLNDTTDTWTQYWYHPLLKRFYVLENIDEILELPDFDEPTQTRWNTFIGDAKDMNLNNFTFARIRELISSGSSEAEAEALVASLETNQQQTPAGQGTQPANRAASFAVNAQASSQPGATPAVPSNLPRMIQRQSTSSPGEKTILDTYTFNLRPNNVSYSNIGITWTEVERVNNFPLVDYRTNKLMKISFEFVVENRAENVSSLFESCETRLQQLQRMANRPELVVFTNFDSLFGEAAIFSATQANYREWAIVEMSINSVQRSPSGTDSQIGAISRATVQMTIQEVRLTKDQVIFMPKLRKVPGIPKVPTPTTEPELCPEKVTDLFGPGSDGLYSPCWYKNRNLPVPS